MLASDVTNVLILQETDIKAVKRWFLFLFMLFLCNIANIAQRTFEIVPKSRSCGRGDIIISTNMSTMSPEISTCEVPSDVSRKLRADFVYDNGVVEVNLLHV